MAIVLLLMLAGILCGYLFRNYEKFKLINDRLTGIAIYALLFLLGISVGTNKTIIQNIHVLGINALIITTGSIIGSVVFLWFIYIKSFLGKDKIQ